MSERARARAARLGPVGVPGLGTTELTEGWTLASSPPGAWAAPSDVPADAEWSPATVPGTVAQAVGGADLDGHADYDALDWWFRCTVPGPEATAEAPLVTLELDGLATLAEVWWNGARVLDATNMFHAWEVDIGDVVRPENELWISFRSLGAALAEKRPRPRWKTRLVAAQRLRWFRTTLLGRIPGWTPAIAPVGPWRPVRLRVAEAVDVRSLELRTDVRGGDGIVEVRAVIAPCTPEHAPTRARLRVGDAPCELTVEPGDGTWLVHGTARVPDPERWWPRTHGEPVLHDCALELETSGGALPIDCGRIGFRELGVDRTDGRIELLVNGTPVFCRGACWTSSDLISLGGSPAHTRRLLGLLADASGNMVRVGGTMVYESDDFYRACDELGVMVWQDFMFANMDYPVDDDAFAGSVELEARQQIGRLAPHPSVVAFCGGSEVEQQAAMFGAPREIWSNELFSETLPALVAEHAPDRAYWPSTPTGGALPFHLDTGLAHYFGVGAYGRPLTDARLARVRFSPECLGFANVPEPANLRGLTEGGAVPPHHPAWKAGVPRDTGAGWDFDDVRDGILEELYDVDAVGLRSTDPDGYLRLSRVATGRAMAAVFDEWRSPEHPCGGGLVWFLSDLRPGAGWGVIDSSGAPKPVYYFLKRAWSPVRVALLDRGLDGLRVEVHNETGSPLDAQVELRVFDADAVVLAQGARSVHAPARGVEAFSLEQTLGHFADPTYAYRFGPRRHCAIEAVARFEGGRAPCSALYWSGLSDALPSAELGVSVALSEGAGALSLEAEGVVREVRVTWDGWAPSDNYFDLMPGSPRRVDLARDDLTELASGGFVEAANHRGARLSPEG